MEGISPDVVARWMLDQVEREGELYQETAVYDLERQFGEDFVYENESGNPAIDKRVLKAFRKISEESVVWERGERRWRMREETDEPGRRQY